MTREVLVQDPEQRLVRSLDRRRRLGRDAEHRQVAVHLLHHRECLRVPGAPSGPGAQDPAELGPQERLLLAAVRPAVVHGRLQQALGSEGANQPCDCILQRRGRDDDRFRVSCLEVLEDAGRILHECPVGGFEHRYHEEPDRGHDARREIRMRREPLDVRNPLLDQVAAGLAGVQRQRAAPECVDAFRARGLRHGCVHPTGGAMLTHNDVG
jgi:hypothetical protein